MGNVDNLSETPQDQTNLIPAFRLEMARAAFTPQSQNIVGILAAAREPISAGLIAHYSSNEDEVTQSNPVAVTEEEVRTVIGVIQQAEKKHGVQLLETAPIKLQHEKRSSQITDMIVHEGEQQEMGFRFSEQIQTYIEKNYPDLWKTFHGFFADRMILDLKALGIDFGEPEEAKPKKTVERARLIKSDDTLGKLVDGAATALLPKGD